MLTEHAIIDLERWERELPHIAEIYGNVQPFPHSVFDDFLEHWAAEEASAVFPQAVDGKWIHYAHVNERKQGLNKQDLIPRHFNDMVEALNSPGLIAWLENLTGIKGLKADPQLEGGGLHRSERGGFLNVHADFTAHPHKRNWRRRVNLLIYLNKDWQEEWGGQLELWERDMSQCSKRIAPLFNRCVIFTTDRTSYHGFPDPLTCPEGVFRKSLALYYFTEEAGDLPLHTTHYRARPADGFRSIMISADNLAIALYTRIKRTFGINDDLISKILFRLHKKK